VKSKRAESGELIRIGGREIKITRPEKVLFPDDGITKRELVEYYHRISGKMVPLLRGRPLSFQRFPDGIGAGGFFQQAAQWFYPKWIHTATTPKQGGEVKHVVCDDGATLVYLATQACITLHAWLSRAEHLEQPDQMVFDLDPSPDDFEAVKQAARIVKSVLDELGLPAFLKTTGSRGLHVVAPLRPLEDFGAVRGFARAVAAVAAGREPQLLTTEQRKDKRDGIVFIDTNRNAYAQTAAPAYTVRARKGAPISTPLAWEELDRRDLKPDGYTIRNLFERIESRPDPWQDFRKHAATLAEARRRLESHHAA
jgi:bifunctional non-homologous end joining protein LigD